MSRLRNPVLAAILRGRAMACGFRGDAGMAKLATVLSGSAGIEPPLSSDIVKAYLGGWRTPPRETVVHLCRLLRCAPDTTATALAAVDEHQRAVQARRDAARARRHLSPAASPQ